MQFSIYLPVQFFGAQPTLFPRFSAKTNQKQIGFWPNHYGHQAFLQKLPECFPYDSNLCLLTIYTELANLNL